MLGWGYTNVRGNPPMISTEHGLELNALQDGNIIALNEPIYWIAPESYIGNKVIKVLN